MTEIARSKLKGPILGIKITAILGVLYCLFTLVSNLVGGSEWMYSSYPAEHRGLIKGFGIGGSVIGLAAAAFLWMGAGKMERLQGYNMALATAIVAMVPCVSPCCCLGVPIGIWAVIVLSRPEVKSAFTG